MGLTLVEKIISEHAGKNVHAGELVISKVDVAAVQDGTGPLTVQEFKKLGVPKLKNPERSILFIDHAAPSPRKELSNTHMVLREFAKENDILVKFEELKKYIREKQEEQKERIHFVLAFRTNGKELRKMLEEYYKEKHKNQTNAKNKKRISLFVKKQ